jgi:hypothetical protein
MSKRAKPKLLKPIFIETIMNATQKKDSGLNKLSPQELANLNAFLNLPRTRQLLAPGPKPNEATPPAG